jgi:transposase
MQSKKSQNSRRKYDASFKQEVTGMIAAGRSVADISLSLGTHENIIYRWRREALSRTEQVQGAGSSQVSLSEHLALQKRLREVEMERDILKKALGIFSRPQ